ncbi:unnamed protein product, partial [Nesidiocoris tenuis]
MDIKECESNPCQFNSTCIERSIRDYYLSGDPMLPEHFDQPFDYSIADGPCVHGECVDGVASYNCLCEGIYGGKNCSVELTACRSNPCKNGGTCIPYLEGETTHKFNCSCTNGFQGHVCET